MNTYKLTDTQAAFVRQVRQRGQELRQAYLAALGLAKETEGQQTALQANFEQQIELIVYGAGLPPGCYAVSADGLTLNRQDIAPVPPVPMVAAPQDAAMQYVNGAPANGN